MIIKRSILGVMLIIKDNYKKMLVIKHIFHNIIMMNKRKEYTTMLLSSLKLYILTY